METTQEILQKAIVKIKNKFLPSLSTEIPPFVPEEEYKQLFSMLEVWDSQREDGETNNRTKAVFEYLKERGNPKELLVTILTKLGATPPLERRLDRVYKYVRLQGESNRLTSQLDITQKEINALGNH